MGFSINYQKKKIIMLHLFQDRRNIKLPQMMSSISFTAMPPVFSPLYLQFSCICLSLIVSLVLFVNDIILGCWQKKVSDYSSFSNEKHATTPAKISRDLCCRILSLSFNTSIITNLITSQYSTCIEQKNMIPYFYVSTFSLHLLQKRRSWITGQKQRMIFQKVQEKQKKVNATYIYYLYSFLQLNRKMGCDNSQAVGVQPTDIAPESMPRQHQPYHQLQQQPQVKAEQGIKGYEGSPPLQIFSKTPLSAVKPSKFDEDERTADGLFRDGKYLQAIAAYQKIIQSGYTVNFQIEGLGCVDHAISRYEWFIYRWYDEKRTKGAFRGNVFDALSLCFCQIRNDDKEIDKGVLWYEDMLAEKESPELYMGYGNLYYHKIRYEDAEKMYRKAIAMRPNFVNAYVGIAMMHEFRRIYKPKAIETAKKIMEIEPDNMYALLIMARNQKTIDDRIQALIKTAEKHPEYYRLLNLTGINYSSKDNYREAIAWYKKCIEKVPEFMECYNNLGSALQDLKQHRQAMPYFFHACEIKADFKSPHTNIIKSFENLKFSDQDIFEEMKKYSKLDTYNFYYFIGIAHYDKLSNNQALKWYKRAEEIKQNHEICNSLGLVYDRLEDYKNGEAYYLKSMELSPKYRNPYYNLGLLYAHKKNEDMALTWYQKAVQLDPSYALPYNNMSTIYQTRNDYYKAIECLKKAVENNSTYTLAYTNLGICYLKVEMYQDAFNVLAMAKEILPTDNNNLSAGNKAFLKETLEKFDREGEMWRRTGSIGLKQKEQLQSLIKSFEGNFRQVYSTSTAFRRKDQLVLKPGLLNVINLIHQDKFQLKNIDAIFAAVKHIFSDSEDYFHIIPQIFIQYFWNNAFTKQRPILEIESQLFGIVQKLSKKESNIDSEQQSGPSYKLDIKMKNFSPPSEFKVNLFKDTTYFNSYEILYSEIVKVNKEAEASLKEFTDFVENVKGRSNGIPYGVCMKLPKRAEQQFKVILRILEKMFKNEIDKQRVNLIISKIDKELRTKGNAVTLINIVHEIIEVWTKEITIILQERKQKKIQTTCAISDLLRGKIMFNTVEDLAKAVHACDKLCHLRGYQILELDNRLSKPQTMDVVLKIKVNEAVCELQLAMRQDESKYHFIHSIYEIERSPLGCIFGSYLFMSKGFNYPILANCKDIEERLKSSEKEEDRKTVEAARYIIDALDEKEEK